MNTFQEETLWRDEADLSSECRECNISRDDAGGILYRKTLSSCAPWTKNNLLRFYQGATEQKDQASFPNAQPQSREHVTADVLTVCELKSLFACSTFREVPVTTQTRTHFVGQPLCDATK